MRPIYLTILYLFLTTITNQLTAQNTLGIEWQNSFGDELNMSGQGAVYTREGDIVTLASGYIVGRNGYPFTPPHSMGNIILVKFSGNGNYKWGKVYAGEILTGKQGYDIVQTQDGGFAIVGQFSDYTDYRSISYKTLVIKTDSLGNLQWEKHLGNSNSELGTAIGQKKDGTIIVTGTTNSNDVPAPKGAGDIFITALDTAGNVLSNFYIGGSATEDPQAIAMTSDGGFVIAGTTGSKDGIFAGAGGYPVGFVLKFNASNTLQWHSILDAESLRLGDIIEDSEGHYFVMGTVSGPTPGDANSLGSSDVWIGKLNKEGALIWEKRLGGIYGEDGFSIAETADHELAVSGMAGSYDGDFSANTKHHKYWVARVNKQSGRITHQAFLGGTNFAEHFDDIVAAPDGGILAVGRSEESNPFVSDFKGGYDLWMVKLQPNLNTIEGNIFQDITPNGIKDINEPVFSSGQVKIKRNATDSVLVSCEGGYFVYPVDTGKFEVSFVPYKPYYQVAPASKTYTYKTYFNRDTVSFGVIPTGNITDLSVNAWSALPARMGNNIDIGIRYTNAGTTTTNAVLKFVKDPRTDFKAATLPLTQVKDTLLLTITNLKPNETGEAVLTLFVKTPPDINWNDTLNNVVSIASAGTDQSPADNAQTLRLPIRAAFDPNDKEEITLPGKMFTKQVQDKAYLAYRIRFQNVGNDTAFTIIVKDTIDARLDINTLEMITADHSYTMQTSQGKYVEWHFDNIQLPDSTVNEPSSHGFLLFRIKPRNTVAIGDTIKNSASIYFDYNLPVATNTVRTAIVPDMPPTPAVNGIGTSYCNNQGVQKSKINNLPATVTKTTATVFLDNAPLSIATDSTFAFKIDTLAPGAHIIIVKYANASGSTQTGIAFTIDPLITPLVDLTTNISNVTNLTTPVTMTALSTNGGINPQYTFAKDRNFNNIIQAASAAPSLTITPSTLTVGDNWFYVRLKTTVSCYKTETVVDSILVRRDQATGIIDPANPGTIISISPNPFHESLTIRGMHSGRQYLLTITSTTGQVIKRMQIRNQSQIQLPVPGLKAGIYWLNLFDANGKQLGTEKLIKN